MKATIGQNKTQLQELQKTMDACYEEISKLGADIQSEEEVVKKIDAVVPK